MTRQIRCFLVSFLVLSIISYVLTCRAIRDETDELSLVNRFGFQRMLVQRYAVQIYRGVLEATVKDAAAAESSRQQALQVALEFEAVQQALLTGGELQVDPTHNRAPISVEPLEDEVTRAALFRATEQWEELKRMAEGALQSGPRDLPAPRLVEQLQAQTEKTIDLLNQAIGYLHYGSQERLRWLLLVQRIAVVTATILFVGILWLVRYRIVVPMRQSIAVREKHEALVNAILDSVDDGVIAANAEGEIICYNLGAEKILDSDLDEHSEKGQWMNKYAVFELDGKTPIKVEALPLSAAIHGRSTKHRELILRSDQGDMTLSVSASPLISHSHSGGVVWFQDITEQNQLRQQLAQAQKLESVGQLAAGIAHEINTPLQFLSDNIEFLNTSWKNVFEVVDRYRELLVCSEAMPWDERLKEIDDISKECFFDHIRLQLPEAIEESREGIERTVKIVKAMRDFSHLGMKTKTLVDLNEAIEGTVMITRNRWKYSATIDLQLAEDLPKVLVFAAEINQVLLNLANNATDAILERVEEGELGLISIRSRYDDDWVIVEVADNGCGIPDNLLDRIYDPFFTTKEVGKGTGQGLAITHNIVVNMHDGQIGVDSQVDVGTVFSVYLPRVQENADKLGEQPAESLQVS